MTSRIHLPSSLIAALLLGLGGCASQQTTGETADGLNQRLASVEATANSAQNQAAATQGLIGELSKKIEGLLGVVRQVHDAQEAQNGRQVVQAAQLAQVDDRLRTATDAAAQRLERVEQRLNDLAKEQQGLQATWPALRDKAGEVAPQIEQLAARIAQNDAGQHTAAAALAERLGQAEQRLNALAAQGAAVQAALPALNEKAAAAGPRLDELNARLAALDKRLDEVAQMAQDALDATGMGQRKIFGKVLFSVTLTEDKTMFPINSPTLGEKDMAQLNALAARLKTLGTNYHLQIQGHTDGFGSEDYNYELGKARAEVVKNYLNEKCGIALLRMSVISYGATEAGSYAAKSNRRIVIQVVQ